MLDETPKCLDQEWIALVAAIVAHLLAEQTRRDANPDALLSCIAIRLHSTDVLTLHGSFRNLVLDTLDALGHKPSPHERCTNSHDVLYQGPGALSR